MQHIIYGLIDPLTKEIRYIGKSSTGLKRPKKHFFPSVLKNEKTYKNRWVNKVIATTGLFPKIVIIDSAENEADVYRLEIEYIQMFKEAGIELTNLHDGGNGWNSRYAKEMRKLVSRESNIKGGKAAAESGLCARNNLKLRKPIIATSVKTGEQRWYLSASHAAADGLGSRSAISNSLRPAWRCRHNKGWTFQYVQTNLPT